MFNHKGLVVTNSLRNGLKRENTVHFGHTGTSCHWTATARLFWTCDPNQPKLFCQFETCQLCLSFFFYFYHSHITSMGNLGIQASQGFQFLSFFFVCSVKCMHQQGKIAQPTWGQALIETWYVIRVHDKVQFLFLKELGQLVFTHVENLFWLKRLRNPKNTYSCWKSAWIQYLLKVHKQQSLLTQKQQNISNISVM